MGIAQLRGWLRVGLHFHKEVAVMGGNDIVVGKPSIRKTSTPAAGSRTFEQQDDRRKADPREPRPVVCGAMSQQRDDSGSQSMPQKLVQLVGCRDSEAGNPRAEKFKAEKFKAEKLKEANPEAKPPIASTRLRR
jgi:hypothetical protein